MIPFPSHEDLIEFVNSLDAFAVLDKHGYYVYVSPHWCEGFGVTAKAAIGKRVWELVPDTHARLALETKKTIIGRPVQFNGRSAFTTYIPRLDGNGDVQGCFIYTLWSNLEDSLAISQRVKFLSTQLEYYKTELSQERGAKYSLDNIIGHSDTISHLKEQIRKAAASASNVLIEGESGSGKELIANSIHFMSDRRPGPFVKMNCSAIPDNMMEAEFFGIASDAYAGGKPKRGRFEMAKNGSIFIDEVNLLTSLVQPKLLNALQEKEITPVDSNEGIPINVRVITSTRGSLESLVREDKFRSDLYYKLSVIKITAPPLRSHKEDIPELAIYLLQQLNLKMGTAVRSIDRYAINLLMDYNWPGNVRELQTILESAINFTDSDILRKEDFIQLSKRSETKNLTSKSENSGYRLKDFMFEFESEIIQNALDKAAGNRSRAASILGISRTDLYKKMHLHNLM